MVQSGLHSYATAHLDHGRITIAPTAAADDAVRFSRQFLILDTFAFYFELKE
jgi:hypothetical protein